MLCTRSCRLILHLIGDEQLHWSPYCRSSSSSSSSSSLTKVVGSGTQIHKVGFLPFLLLEFLFPRLSTPSFAFSMTQNVAIGCKSIPVVIPGHLRNLSCATAKAWALQSFSCSWLPPKLPSTPILHSRVHSPLHLGCRSLTARWIFLSSALTDLLIHRISRLKGELLPSEMN